jgi:hypothetical protein
MASRLEKNLALCHGRSQNHPILPTILPRRSEYEQWAIAQTYATIFSHIMAKENQHVDARP